LTLMKMILIFDCKKADFHFGRLCFYVLSQLTKLCSGVHLSTIVIHNICGGRVYGAANQSDAPARTRDPLTTTTLRSRTASRSSALGPSDLYETQNHLNQRWRLLERFQQPLGLTELLTPVLSRPLRSRMSWLESRTRIGAMMMLYVLLLVNVINANKFRP